MAVVYISSVLSFVRVSRQSRNVLLTDPAGVAGDIVDAIRIGPSQLLVHKVIARVLLAASTSCRRSCSGRPTPSSSCPPKSPVASHSRPLLSSRCCMRTGPCELDGWHPPAALQAVPNSRAPAHSIRAPVASNSCRVNAAATAERLPRARIPIHQLLAPCACPPDAARFVRQDALWQLQFLDSPPRWTRAPRRWPGSHA